MQRPRALAVYPDRAELAYSSIPASFVLGAGGDLIGSDCSAAHGAATFARAAPRAHRSELFRVRRFPPTFRCIEHGIGNDQGEGRGSIAVSRMNPSAALGRVASDHMDLGTSTGFDGELVKAVPLRATGESEVEDHVDVEFEELPADGPDLGHADFGVLRPQFEILRFGEPACTST
jgi:hypothetical protein